MLERHPEAFDSINRDRILGNVPGRTGHVSPHTNPKFREYFGSSWDERGLRSVPMDHHHVGMGGQAAAMPRPIHTGKHPGNVHFQEDLRDIQGRDDEVAEMLERFLKGTDNG